MGKTIALETILEETKRAGTVAKNTISGIISNNCQLFKGYYKSFRVDTYGNIHYLLQTQIADLLLGTGAGAGTGFVVDKLIAGPETVYMPLFSAVTGLIVGGALALALKIENDTEQEAYSARTTLRDMLKSLDKLTPKTG